MTDDDDSEVLEGIQARSAENDRAIDELEKQLAWRLMKRSRYRGMIRAYDAKKRGRKPNSERKVGEAATKSDVIEYLEEVLGTGSVTDEVLRPRVASMAEARGKSKVGLALILKRVLNDGRFKLGPDGWSKAARNGKG